MILPNEGTLITLPFRSRDETLVVTHHDKDEDGREYIVAHAPGITVALYADGFYREEA